MSKISKTAFVTPQSEGVITNHNTGELQNIQATYKLNGKNYFTWSQLVHRFLKGKGKLNHLLGIEPRRGDSQINAQDERGSMVMVQLWNSMTPEISNTCMFLTIARDIWNAVHQTHSKALNVTQVYEIKVKTKAAKKGNKTIIEYANMLKNL